MINVETKAIKRILVKKLFGLYDYVLSPPEQAVSPERLLILYGDNGSGKTTILRTLFHLLAPEGGAGHKSAVAQVPFSRFEVDFTSGERVWAERSTGSIAGSFKMGLGRVRCKTKTCDFITNEEGAVSISSSSEYASQVKSFLKELRLLEIGMFYLSDDRIMHRAGYNHFGVSSTAPRSSEDELSVHYRDDRVDTRPIAREVNPETRATQLLERSLKRTWRGFQSQAVRGSTEGESSVNTLYGEIIRRIVSLPPERVPKQSDTISSIGKRINELEVRSRNYSKYGLLPEFNGHDIMKIIKQAPLEQIGIITGVITPYFESVEMKLDAMERLQRKVDSLVHLVNSFFTKKSISFEIHKGFELSTEAGEPLAPQMLSSGERHLLLLLCNTVVALDRSSIFLIDEPEISLNIKWQRKLLTSILECTGDNPVQYLFATHSFELLAQHRNNTIKLECASEATHGS